VGITYLQNCKIHILKKLRIFKISILEFKKNCHFNIVLVINHRAYYKEENDEFLPCLNHGCLVSWVPCGLFVHHLGSNFH
jgi:hypothetical protein